jgi:hypothetical protein
VQQLVNEQFKKHVAETTKESEKMSHLSNQLQDLNSRYIECLDAKQLAEGRATQAIEEKNIIKVEYHQLVDQAEKYKKNETVVNTLSWDNEPGLI